MTLGEKIRRLRKIRGLSAKRLGEICGISEVTVNKYERNVIKPKDDILEQLKITLGTSAAMLMREPDFDNPLCVMQFFFELEEKYGLWFEKCGDDYVLCFHKGEYQAPDTLLDFIDSWILKREEVQNHLMKDSITLEEFIETKNKYFIWKAEFGKGLQSGTVGKSIQGECKVVHGKMVFVNQDV